MSPGPAMVVRSGPGPGRLEVDTRGRAIVDEHLRSLIDARIFAIGDYAA